jgi:SAM-dependent methyltransferase
MTSEYYENYWSDSGFCPSGSTGQSLSELLTRYIEDTWTCLDVGCGDGGTAGSWLQPRVRSYVGVDISGNAVRRARKMGLGVAHIEDASSLPFGPASFDTVLCLEVLEHLMQPQAAVAEILRVLKPGGLLLVSVPNVAYWRRRIDLVVLGRWNPLGDDRAVVEPWRDPHIRFFNPGALQRILSFGGFERVRVMGRDGALLRDVPWIGSRLACGPSSGGYRAAERLLPSLLAYRLYGLAEKPRAAADAFQVP